MYTKQERKNTSWKYETKSLLQYLKFKVSGKDDYKFQNMYPESLGNKGKSFKKVTEKQNKENEKLRDLWEIACCKKPSRNKSAYNIFTAEFALENANNDKLRKDFLKEARKAWQELKEDQKEKSKENS